MRLHQEQPKFLPMTLTFETPEEWQLFQELIISAEASNTWNNAEQINDMIWSIHQLILQGLRKI